RFCDAERNGKYIKTALGDNYVLDNPKLPIFATTYEDAAEYARWANKRLPTEAEWEKAASWDPTTKTKRLYLWGNEADASLANLGRSEKPKLTAGGTYPKDVSPYGVFDMGGNVKEWVEGFFAPYSSNNSSSKNKIRIVRGGSFGTKDITT